MNIKLSKGIKIIGLCEIIIGLGCAIFSFYKIIQVWDEGMNSSWSFLTLPAILLFFAPPFIISLLVLKGGVLVVKLKSKGRDLSLIGATGVLIYVFLVPGILGRLFSFRNIITILIALFFISFFNHPKVKEQFK